ncbi:MAG: hypothetical protein AB1Y26_05470 [Cycloclasticus sp.]
MKKILLLLILMLPLGALAETSQSIMFADPDAASDKKTLTSVANKQEAHCKKLRQKMQDLKGKPQRRWTVSERIKVECESNNYGTSTLPLTD